MSRHDAATCCLVSFPSAYDSEKASLVVIAPLVTKLLNQRTEHVSVAIDLRPTIVWIPSKGDDSVFKHAQLGSREVVL